MNKKTQVEYDRIKAGPQKGMFTFLHHEGPVVEQSKNVMERVDYILENKSASQHYDRLRHIHWIDLLTLPQEAEAKRQEADVKWQEADVKRQEAEAKRQEADVKWQEADVKRQEADVKWQEAEASLATALIPNCGWNGSSIFTK